MPALATPTLTLSLDTATGALTATATRTGRLLFRTLSHAPACFRPVLDDAAAPLTLADARATPASLTLRYTSAALEVFTVHLALPDGEDAIDLSCTFRPRAACQLNRLDLFPAGTQLNFYDAHNYRNRHHTAATAPELPLGGAGCSTDTFSTDWQFAPHPTALFLRANDIALFCGALDLPRSFGMYFSAADYRLRHWYLDHGTIPHGQSLAAGETFASPRIRLFLRDSVNSGPQTLNPKPAEPAALYAEFGAMLVRAGLIPDPEKKHRHAWHTAPLYCTWIDQMFGANAEIASDLREQAAAANTLSPPNPAPGPQADSPAARPLISGPAAPTATPVTLLNETLVNRAIEVIKREHLPVRTILLDDGWQIARGQWEPHPQRFPDLRALADSLHARNFKVVVWWNWAEIQPHANVDPVHLARNPDGTPWINRHGCRMRDYSHPVTQNNYLYPLFRKLFSSAPDCYDLDGVKTDFLADKVHPDMPLHDPSWRGEENYMLRVTRLFYEEMRRHKPDAVHIGCAGHYRLAEFIDINRTYDVASSNWREHEERAAMLSVTAPGVPIAYDFHNYTENLDRWFASARAFPASVQIGNVLYTKRDRFSPPQPAAPSYLAILHNELATT